MLPRLTHLCLLLVGALGSSAAAEPILSEFLASNQRGITDEDGSRPDWVEIHNPDAAPVDLNGWFLTDSATNLQKWAFPAISIPAKGYLLVFASGKNRRIPGSNLHTNFELSTSGEYLALIRPGGQSASSEFAPAFPQQYADVSYGTSSTLQRIVLARKGTTVRAHVPVDNTLGTTWRQRVFDDAQWLSGPLAVGYFNYLSNSSPDLSADIGINVRTQAAGQQRGIYVRVPFSIANPAGVQQLKLRMNYDDGFTAFVNGQFAAAANSPAPGVLAFNSMAPANHNPGGFEEFDISSQVSQLVAGENVLAIHALNQSASSSDFFILPELTVAMDSGAAPVTGYFITATPGTANGGPETIQLPQQVTFSRAAGTFTEAFALTLGGAAAGQQIRYEVNDLKDPSDTRRANLPEPTLSSPLYSGPLQITSSTLIRAAVFDVNNGQKSASLTAQYLQLETALTSNTSNFSSHLPILVTDDHGAGQPVDSGSNTYTSSLFHVFEPVAGVATLNVAPTLFTRAGTRIRGSSSAGFAKKSYGLELWDERDEESKHPLLGMGSDSDWVLNGPYSFDRTYIHNAFAYELSRRLGRWAPRTAFVEMFFNQNGGKLDYADYAGVYVLTEKISSSNDRLDIEKIRPADNSGDALTGGYIFKIDRADGNEVAWNTVTPTGARLPNAESGQSLVIVEPDPKNDTSEQVQYLQSYVQSFNSTLFSEQAAGFTTRNYLSYIDRGSWIDHHLLNSIAYNVDGLRLSAFFFKDRGGKINAGPAWDFDRSLGGGDRDTSPRSWNNIDYYFDRDWWGPLFRDPDFVQAWIDRWTQLRQPGQPFDLAILHGTINSMAAEVGNAAAARDSARWSQNVSRFGNYAGEITNMRTWLSDRVSFIDSRTQTAPVPSQTSSVVSPGTTITLGGGGTIRYTLDGADPRATGGGVNSGSLIYNSASGITINQTTVLTARRQATISLHSSVVTVNWTAPVKQVYLVNEAFATAGDLVISELHFNPLGPTAAESAVAPGATADDFEFLELKNVGSRRVNLFEVQFAQGKPFDAVLLDPRSLSPGDTAVVVRNRAAFIARYGTAAAAKIVGEWKRGVLSNGGELIQILGRDGTLIQGFSYSDDGEWPQRADGRGSSLEYIGTGVASSDAAVPGNWRASSEIHGSPGTLGAGPNHSIVINELLTHSNAPRVDAIELYNTGGTALDLSGWYLSDEKSPETVDSYRKFRIPDGTVIPAFGYVVFNETQFNPNGSWNQFATQPGPNDFAFDAHHGDEAWLVQPNASGTPVRFVDNVAFGAARADEAFGRWPNGSGSFYPLQTRTLLNENSGSFPRPGVGAPNSAPRVGPVVISEVQHSPSSAARDHQFVEIRNTGNVTESLARWKLRGAVDFDFALPEALAPGALLVVVPFSPADAAKSASFRAAYGISDAVRLVGPWSTGDSLSSGSRVVVYRAGPMPPAEPGFYPQLLEDETRYSSILPWPSATGGLSLNRRGDSSIGNIAQAWKSDVPSPGSHGPTLAQWRAHYFALGGAGTADQDDFDQDGATNGLEYTRGTNPRTAENQVLFDPAFMRQPGGSGYVFTFTRPVDRPGARYVVQQSGDLQNWVNIPDSAVSVSADQETRQVVVPITPDTPQELFFRLWIDLGS